MQKAKDLSEITKLNMAVSESETKINEIYSEIGYKVYCAYRENPLEEVKEEIGQIRELEEAMEACKLQIQAINAMNSCPRCGAKIKPEMMFCSSCGMKLQVSGRRSGGWQIHLLPSAGSPGRVVLR